LFFFHNELGECGKVIRSSSEPSVTAEKAVWLRGWSTTGDLLSNSTFSKDVESFRRKKSCAFKTGVRVILITTRSEYVAAGLSDSLWWSEHDYKTMKEEAVKELKEVMARSPKNIDCKAALEILYQPVGGGEETILRHSSKSPSSFSHLSTTSESSTAPEHSSPLVLPSCPSTDSLSSGFPSASPRSVQEYVKVQDCMKLQDRVKQKRHSFSEEKRKKIPVFKRTAVDDILLSGFLLRAGTDRDLISLTEMKALHFPTLPLHPMGLMCEPI